MAGDVTRADRLTRHELALEAGVFAPVACLCGPGDAACEAPGCGGRPTHFQAGGRGEEGRAGRLETEAAGGFQGAPLELLVDDCDRWVVRPLGGDGDHAPSRPASTRARGGAPDVTRRPYAREASS